MGLALGSIVERRSIVEMCSIGVKFVNLVPNQLENDARTIGRHCVPFVTRYRFASLAAFVGCLTTPVYGRESLLPSLVRWQFSLPRQPVRLLFSLHRLPVRSFCVRQPVVVL